MLIQNTSNIAQAQTPARLAGDGGPVVVVAPPNVQAQPSATPDLPQTAARPVAEKQLTTAELQNALASLNKTLQQSNKNLEFTIDDETNNQVVKLVDSETGDVIRQFPSEEMLAISRAIENFQQGILIKQEA